MGAGFSGTRHYKLLLSRFQNDCDLEEPSGATS